MAKTKDNTVTFYEILQVHPAAPPDLITAAYWSLTGHVQSSRAEDGLAQRALYHLTRSYETLSKSESRMNYDLGIGLRSQPVAPGLPRRSTASGLARLLPFRREPAAGDVSVDYYEIMRVDPGAHASVVREAYGVIRNVYLRLVSRGHARPELLDWLEEARAVLSDPARREQYDTRRGGSDAPAATPAVNGAKHSVVVREAPRAAARPDAPVADASAAALAPPELARQDTVPAITSEAPEARGAEASPVPTISSKIQAAPETRQTPLKPAEKTGEGIVSALAQKATLRLRQALNVQPPAPELEIDVDEEAVLIDRLATAPRNALAPGEESSDGAHVLARLTLVDGPGLGSSFEVGSVPFTLGGDDGCDVSLPGLASHQARLLHRNGQFVLYNLADEPATRIHGDAVAWAVLEDGDSVEVGPYKLRFEFSNRDDDPA